MWWLWFQLTCFHMFLEPCRSSFSCWASLLIVFVVMATVPETRNGGFLVSTLHCTFVPHCSFWCPWLSSQLVTWCGACRPLPLARGALSSHPVMSRSCCWPNTCGPVSAVIWWWLSSVGTPVAMCWPCPTTPSCFVFMETCVPSAYLLCTKSLPRSKVPLLLIR